MIFDQLDWYDRTSIIHRTLQTRDRNLALGGKLTEKSGVKFFVSSIKTAAEHARCS